MRALLMSAALACSLVALPAAAEPVIGEKAPDFTAADSNGASHKLSDFLGKTVVLEWTNHECPFVVKHYGSGNMQALQAKWTEKGVVWLKVNSSGEGKQGHVDGTKANAILAEQKAKPTAILLDASGAVGRAYGARTTPHMFVIDGTGVLRYAGAIDDRSSADPADIEGATNYVDAALTALADGKPIATPQTRAYGCSVKYSETN